MTANLANARRCGGTSPVRQTTPSAAPAALENYWRRLTLASLSRYARGGAVTSTGAVRAGGWPRELAGMVRGCNGADTNAHIRPNGV
eukprot:620358-Prymnesium_polylepis.1